MAAPCDNRVSSFIKKSLNRDFAFPSREPGSLADDDDNQHENDNHHEKKPLSLQE